jgi:uncharacterized protein HemY
LAESAFRKAISVGGDAESYYGLARVLAELNRTDEALQLISDVECPYFDEPDLLMLRDEIASGMWCPGDVT